MNPAYADIMGYNESELIEVFHEHFLQISKDEPLSILDELRTWYNGYRFSEKTLSVYNPYSTLRYLKENKPKNFWYSSATPYFLIKVLKNIRAI